MAADRVEIELIKGEFREYAKKKYLIEKYEGKIADVVYVMSGVKGVRFDTVRGSSAIGTEEKNEKWRRLIDVYEKKIKTWKESTDRVEHLLGIIKEKNEEDHRIFEVVYVEVNSFAEATKKLGMSSTSVLENRIARALERALEEEEKKATYNG